MRSRTFDFKNSISNYGEIEIVKYVWIIKVNFDSL